VAEYPNAVPTLKSKAEIDASNGGLGGPSDDAVFGVSALAGKANDEIEAIATELGTNPSGTEATVVARFNALDATVAAKAADSALTAHVTDTSGAHAASAISVDATGFNGNLTTGDTNVQLVAQKVDDLVAGSGIPTTIVDAKGDLIVATAADTPAIVSVGTNGQVLTADSALTAGVKWATPTVYEAVGVAAALVDDLSGVTNASTARTNLGLTASATKETGTTTGTLAAGDDARITGAAQKSSNLSDLSSASTARTNLGLGGAAVLNVGTSAGTVAAGDDSRFSTGVADGDKGDIVVSSSGTVWTVDTGAVTNAKLATQSQATIKGRAAGAGTGTVTDLTPAQTWAILSQSTNVFNVRSYGALGDGSTNDAAAINLAIADLNAATYGGTLYFPPGDYRITSALTTVTKPLHVLGAGSGERNTAAGSASKVTMSSSTASAFTVSSAAPRFTDIAIVNYAYDPSTLALRSAQTLPTAGSAIVATNSYGAQIVGCNIVGFYDNIDLENGGEWTIDRTQVWAPVRYNVRVRNSASPDFGDASLLNSWFIPIRGYSNATANVRWESGGGLRVIGNKFNGGSASAPYSSGPALDLAYSTTSEPTSVLIISGNSFENYGTAGVRLVVTSTAAFSGYVSITGNEFAPYTSSAQAVVITGTSGQHITDVSITGNVMHGESSSAVAVSLTYVDGAILANTYGGWSSNLSLSNCTAVVTPDTVASSTLAGLAPAGSKLYRRSVDYSIGKVLVAETDVFRWYNKTGQTLTIDRVFFSLGTVGTVSTSSPISGKAVVVDVNKNGTTIFTTQANRPAVNTSANLSSTTAPDVTTLADGDYLTFDVDFVGAAGGAAYAVVTVEMSA
jgi:hypothetical protein